MAAGTGLAPLWGYFAKPCARNTRRRSSCCTWRATTTWRASWRSWPGVIRNCASTWCRRRSCPLPWPISALFRGAAWPYSAANPPASNASPGTSTWPAYRVARPWRTCSCPTPDAAPVAVPCSHCRGPAPHPWSDDERADSGRTRNGAADPAPGPPGQEERADPRDVQPDGRGAAGGAGRYGCAGGADHWRRRLLHQRQRHPRLPRATAIPARQPGRPLHERPAGIPCR